MHQYNEANKSMIANIHTPEGHRPHWLTRIH